MGSAETMKLLGQSFIELSESSPLEKISVSDVVEASGKNRKTFYYHFEDKEALIRWIFRRDLADILLDKADESQLVYEEEGPGAMPDLPYYLRRKTGVRSLDGSEFIEALGECLQNRRSYYAKALRPSGPGSLQYYLYRLYTPALEEDVRFILSNRHLADRNIRFLAEFYTGAFVTYLSGKTCDPSCEDILADVRPFQNIVHSSLESAIKEQQLKRAL